MAPRVDCAESIVRRTKSAHVVEDIVIWLASKASIKETLATSGRRV